MRMRDHASPTLTDALLSAAATIILLEDEDEDALVGVSSLLLGELGNRNMTSKLAAIMSVDTTMTIKTIFFILASLAVSAFKHLGRMLS